MERCERCAPAEPGGVFCAVCGSFLGWEQAEDAPPPARPSTPRRSVQPSATEADPPVAVRAPGATRSAATAAPGTGDPTDATTAGPQDALTAADAAARPAGTGTAADQAAGSVEAVQPARPRARRPVVRQRPLRTQEGSGDVVCPACATGNPPDRKFCRRCGAALGTQAGPVIRYSWWRRLCRALFRGARWLVRPRSGGWGLVHRVGTLLIVAALLAGLGYGVVRLGSRASDAVRDRIADPEPVSPVSVRASSQARNHPAEAVVDGLSNSYWAPDPDGAGHGEYVELTFATPFRLLDLIVHPGVAAQRDLFLRQARPAELELTVWTSQHGSETRTLRLADRAGPQTFRRVVGDVVRVRLTVRASYGSAAGRRTALGEVEFFRRP
jgi:hypothetical protein